MPAYRVDVQKSAERDLERLAAPIRQRVFSRLAALPGDPRPAGAEKLQGLDAYRLRVGDYRIVYFVEDALRRVIVTRIRHRRDVYRRLR